MKRPRDATPSWRSASRTGPGTPGTTDAPQPSGFKLTNVINFVCETGHWARPEPLLITFVSRDGVASGQIVVTWSSHAGGVAAVRVRPAARALAWVAGGGWAASPACPL